MIEPKTFSYIDVELMKEMCHPIAVAVFDNENDPISKFGEHEFALLDSALNNPKQTFAGKELYPSLIKKASILYYSINKNHPFKNGNKRISTASLLVFLYINGYWVDGNMKKIEDYLVNLALRVAQSLGIEHKDEIFKDLEFWLEKHIIFIGEKGIENIYKLKK